MDNKEKKKVRNRRREFLGTSVAAGAGIALGIAAGNILKEKSGEKVRMMTASGQLVEVDKRLLPEQQGKPVSNEELKNWMESNKK
ncbi:MAG: twin-arginine translocation signal domain-containing protein [Saprospiraceae bacterium]